MYLVECKRTSLLIKYWSGKKPITEQVANQKIHLDTYDIQLHHPIMGMGLLSQQTRWMTTAEPYKQKHNQKMATFSPKSNSANSQIQ
jgi:hypothetical protein